MSVGRDLIVIGGSMGGLSALCRFVVPLAANFPAAIVVAIYNGPAAGSSTDESAQLPAIVGQHTRLPVLDAVDGAEFHTGTIYLAPQGHHLVVLPTGRSLRAPRHRHRAKPVGCNRARHADKCLVVQPH